jgi:signal transduction histidine kinase
MSADELRAAFEPFFTTKAPGRGTGLGLVIVQHIVRAHGGQVVADSTPGGGTSVRMRFPL